MEKSNSDYAQKNQEDSRGHTSSPLSEHNPRPSSEERTAKAADIVAACGPPADVGALAVLATSKGGLLTDQHRRVACGSSCLITTVRQLSDAVPLTPCGS